MDVKRTAYEEHRACIECRRLKAVSFLNDKGVCEICQQPPPQLSLFVQLPRRRHFRENESYFKICSKCKRRVELREPYTAAKCAKCWPVENHGAYLEIWKLYNKDLS